ncbi:MAG: hypothetical protein HFE67_06120 [Erysipelotrichaceae bacterium]|nr:hypothetical protein [Erysipelotrichaceae bacterium]
MRLRISIGKRCGIQTGNVVAAIIEESGVSAKALGRIEIREDYTLVDVDVAKVDLVLEKMQHAQIRGHRVEIQIEEAPKRKHSGKTKSQSYRKENAKGRMKERSARRGAGRHERSVRKSKSKK